MPPRTVLSSGFSVLFSFVRLRVRAVLLCIMFVLFPVKVWAESYFLGYELGEMAFNDFKNFAGEAGIGFKNNRVLRLSYMDVLLTERHLSSSEANAVDGDNVSGTFEGLELFYDVPITERFYWGLSAGYYKESYAHTILKDSISGESPTLGFVLGFRETNLFGVKNLYMNFSVPFRYWFDPIEETRLGDTTVNNNQFSNNIWFSVGLYIP